MRDGELKVAKGKLIEYVQNGLLTPKTALEELNKHSVRLNEVAVSLELEPLLCGFPTIENHQYILANEGNLVIIAARPGNGKTALACQIGLNVSKRGRVLLFSLEMKAAALRRRLLSVLSGVPIKKLGLPVNSEKVQAAINKQKQYKFDIIDDSDLNINQVISKVIDEHSREPLSLVIIDYIGLIRVNNDLRALGIGEVAERLKKDVSERLRVPVIALAQMNRGFDSRKASAAEGEDVRPNLADIGESSGIEKAADVVMFLHRPSLSDPTIPQSLFNVYVAKNRNGEVKDFSLEFIESRTEFLDKGSY